MSSTALRSGLCATILIMPLPPPSVLIASKGLRLARDDGSSIDVAVEIYKPEAVDDRTSACAFIIRGFEDDIVRHIFGVDSMQALVLSLHVLPTELQALARRAAGRFVTDADLGLDHACGVYLGKR